MLLVSRKFLCLEISEREMSRNYIILFQPAQTLEKRLQITRVIGFNYGGCKDYYGGRLDVDL